MKKLLSVTLVIMMLITVCSTGMFGVTASAATVTSGTTGDCTWTFDGTVLTISGNGDMGNFECYAQSWSDAITEVIIEKGVTSIGNRAFFGCTGLTSVTIPESVTSIGNCAFSGCTNLKYNIYGNGKYLGNENNKYLVLIDTVSTDITEFVFAKGVKFIYEYAFSGCTGLMSVTIPEGVTGIGEGAFEYCTGLTSMTIPEGVTSICGAFYGCTGLTSITIPSSLTSSTCSRFYGPSSGCSFEGCTGLERVNITDIAAWCNIKFGYAESNPLYYAKNLYLNGELIEDLVIPDSVTSISDYAFCSYTGLTSVTIPDGVTSIGDYAFLGCTGFEYVSISTKNIPANAFEDSSKIKNIYFSKKIRNNI